MIAETVFIPNRCKAGTHGRESTIDFFNESRIVLEMVTFLTDRSGTIELN